MGPGGPTLGLSVRKKLRHLKFIFSDLFDSSTYFHSRSVEIYRYRIYVSIV